MSPAGNVTATLGRHFSHLSEPNRFSAPLARSLLLLFCVGALAYFATVYWRGGGDGDRDAGWSMAHAWTSHSGGGGASDHKQKRRLGKGRQTKGAASVAACGECVASGAAMQDRARNGPCPVMFVMCVDGMITLTQPDAIEAAGASVLARVDDGVCWHAISRRAEEAALVEWHRLASARARASSETQRSRRGVLRSDGKEAMREALAACIAWLKTTDDNDDDDDEGSMQKVVCVLDDGNEACREWTAWLRRACRLETAALGRTSIRQVFVRQ